VSTDSGQGHAVNVDDQVNVDVNVDGNSPQPFIISAARY
jgi:hypothetical protein